MGEFKEQRRQEAKKQAGQLTRLEIDIPKHIYDLCDRVAAQDEINPDRFVADALEIYLGDDYDGPEKPHE